MHSKNSVAFALALLLTACASGPGEHTPEASTGDASACATHAREAMTKMQAVVDASSACSTDEDCTTVAFQADCFDACTRTIAKSGQAAFAAAKASANANECRAFASASCKVTVPPCAPPANPTCRAGRCR